ncbi:MAG: NADH-quinone oxidoreductase subunit J [Actinomycetota bacterium]|nr:NADH-quinone oxidoreductase subunit J [Actinomycetota bacterium]
MSLDIVVFGAMFVVTLGSALAMIFARNAVHVALLLVLSQVGLAVAFLLQGAFFIAAVQIIIYAGAIMVLFLFVIMLLGVDRREALDEPLRGQRATALILGALLAAQVLYVAWLGLDVTFAGGGQEAIEAINSEDGNVLGVARVLFGRYLLPFEVTSVLLITAVVGVMVLARRIHSAAPPAGSEKPSEEKRKEAVA